ncbi:MAG: 2-oxoglutarate ferredoxin oxidoreductase subunit alpha [Sandaracinus sp.]|nr:2-oxoglutarate ferredoxin oxidoreductase subunit alpha [Sandaracinus sp.]|tara:strand:- start:1984 stop:3879 length:1896 start_codon:yes stop_codon:yes gene_type:complete
MSEVQEAHELPREVLDSVVIRFCGDSGDGMQLTGKQFTDATALMGNDLATFPDFPAEIRAPAGTTYGVSGFQIHFADHDILTPGDAPDVLVAMNPAALKVNLPDLKRGGLLVVNTGAFNKGNLRKAGYEVDPLEDGSTDPYRLLALDITKLALDSVTELQLGAKDAGRTKNMWTLGLMFWLFDRDRTSTIEWLRKKFSKAPDIAEANIRALNAGHIYGESAEFPSGIGAYQVPKADLAPGVYRNIDGNQALAWGLAAGGQLASLPLFYGSYPITPASSLLHNLAKLKHLGVTTFQAEDEIAAVCAAIGASFGGAVGVTGTSGPGVALKGEAIGLAIATELPLVICDVQRGGPSTGLPTKTEQSDLFQAVWGRNGDAPLIVLAAATPGDCFHMAIEAVRLSTKYMTPVILLTDGYIANGAEPWKLPDMSTIAPFPVTFHTDPEGFFPFQRDPETLARVWAKPGTPGLQHRIGGLEKNQHTGHISYDPDNHHAMVKLRAQKIAGVADDVPEATLELGEAGGDVLVVGWGSTYGSIRQAVQHVRKKGAKVAHLHLRNIWPLPRGLEDLMKSFDRVVVAELNDGQLLRLLRAELLTDAVGHQKIAGQPFRVAELVDVIENLLPSGGDAPRPTAVA